MIAVPSNSDARIPGRRGRTKPSHDSDLLLHKFRGVVETTAPTAFDAAPGLKYCDMLGNDQQSDCGPAGLENGRIVKISLGVSGGSAIAPPSFVVPTTDHTLSWYHAYGVWMGESGYNPDEGVDNLTMLTYLFKITGGVVPKPSGDDIQEWAFAEIAANNLNEVKQALCDFKGLLLGCSLTDNAETEFSNYQPWTISATEQPDPNMGHDIYAVSYSPIFLK